MYSTGTQLFRVQKEVFGAVGIWRWHVHPRLLIVCALLFYQYTLVFVHRRIGQIENGRCGGVEKPPDLPSDGDIFVVCDRVFQALGSL